MLTLQPIDLSQVYNSCILFIYLFLIFLFICSFTYLFHWSFIKNIIYATAVGIYGGKKLGGARGKPSPSAGCRRRSQHDLGLNSWWPHWSERALNDWAMEYQNAHQPFHFIFELIYLDRAKAPRTDTFSRIANPFTHVGTHRAHGPGTTSSTRNNHTYIFVLSCS